MKSFIYFSALAIITLTSFQSKNVMQKVKDYFTIPGPIGYNKTEYNLSWSAHPSDNYYKQEYLPANQKSETFTNMILIEAVVGEISLQDAVKAKVDELEQRKQMDKEANYQLIKNPNTGEYLLDFVISQPEVGTKASIVEWNAYRYVDLKTSTGIKGIQLFAYSRRSYGNGTTNFLKLLKAERINDVNTFVAYKIPVIKIK